MNAVIEQLPPLEKPSEEEELPPWIDPVMLAEHGEDSFEHNPPVCHYFQMYEPEIEENGQFDR